ncbi:MAG: hypothetical protein WAO98_06590 [Alphaproteobacteria bacterium]
MRAVYVLLALLMSITTATAGEVTVANGQATWRSTQCVQPTTPPSLLEADRLSPANDMNVLVTQYNEYVKLMRIYMDCMSNEAQNDANATSNAIVASAQAALNDTQKNVDVLGAPFKKKP